MDSPNLPTVSTPPDETRIRAVAAAVARRAILAALVLLVVVSALALAFPDLDRRVAGLFFVEGRGFPVERMAAAVVLREAGLAVTRWATIALLLVLLAKLFLPRLARTIPSRPLLFLGGSLALGPGLLVNALLKAFWGRPRPREILDFGGHLDFFPAGIPGGGCLSNCSFPSGEASSAIWLTALVFVVPPAWQKPTAIATGLWTLAISVNRMAFGGHFLSDVVIAWVLVGLVVLVCRELILERLPEAAVGRIDDALARSGDRLLGAIGRFGERRSSR
jgi:membrane-associated phospholipid phosphatase